MNNSENLGRSTLSESTAVSEPTTNMDFTQPKTMQNESLNALPSDKALDLLKQDPVGFIQQIVSDAADHHLTNLKEQAELNGAISAFRKMHPEFKRFEPFIVQEAASLLQQDNAIATASWPQILEKAMENFKEKFSQTVQDSQLTSNTSAQNPPYVEGAANRSPAEVPANFTRDQIGKMSMQDFLKNESAINDALKNNRIR